MRKLCFFVILLLNTCYANAQAWKDFDYQTGDILFQDLDCGPLCDAIETVTPAWNGKHFSHAGIVYREGDAVFVIEAIGRDVHGTAIEDFLQRQRDENGNPKVVVGRLQQKYRKLNEAAVNFALAQNSVLYDDAFIYDNGKYYCTELLYDAYKTANGGKAFFKLKPMTYKDPANNKTFPAWTTYYADLGVKIPEGEPGCNPGSVATDKKIDIIKSFY